MDHGRRSRLFSSVALSFAVLIGASAGCESEDNPPNIEVEPAAPDPEPDPASTTESEPDPEPEQVGRRGPQWQARLGSGQLRTRRRDSDVGLEDIFGYDEVEHPVESVRQVINEASREHAVASVRGIMGSARCEATLAHPTLVSFYCAGQDQTGRGGPEQRMRVSTLHLEIVDGEVVPFHVGSAVRGAERMLGERVGECETRRALPGQEGFYRECSADRAVIVMTREALVLRFYGTEGGTIDIERPYGELGDAIRADGPLGPMLGRESSEPPEPASDPGAASDWALTGFEATHRALERWRAMPRSETGPLRVERHRSILARLIASQVSEERATELAQLLGTRARPVVRAGEAETIAWVRTTTELTLREAETVAALTDRPPLAIVPRGALLIAVGTLSRRSGSTSEVLAGGIFGFGASRLMTPHRGCLPEPPEGLEAHLLVRAIVQIRLDGEDRDAVVFANNFGAPRPPWEDIDLPQPPGQVWIHEYERSGCRVGASIIHVDHEGTLSDVRFIGTTQDGGDSLLVVGASPSYEVRLLPDPEVLFTREGSTGVSTRTMRLGEVVDGVYYPVTTWGGEYGSLLRLRWNGNGFDELTAPDPDAQADY